MKKKILFSVLIMMICLLVAGCGSKKEEKKKIDEPVDGGWDINLVEKQASIPEDAKNAFENASNRTSYDITPIALLAKQVVSGTNYMFLCRDNANSNYKIAIVYNNLDNVSQITQINHFDYTKYTHNNIQYNANKTTGHWYVEIPEEGVELSEEVQDIYNEGTAKLVGVDYKPIALLGKQVVSGTNYAVLVYGQLQNSGEEDKGIFLMTVYKDLEGKVDIPSISYIDLSVFNK